MPMARSPQLARSKAWGAEQCCGPGALGRWTQSQTCKHQRAMASRATRFRAPAPPLIRAWACTPTHPDLTACHSPTSPRRHLRHLAHVWATHTQANAAAFTGRERRRGGLRGVCCGTVVPRSLSCGIDRHRTNLIAVRVAHRGLWPCGRLRERMRSVLDATRTAVPDRLLDTDAATWFVCTMLPRCLNKHGTRSASPRSGVGHSLIRRGRASIATSGGFLPRPSPAARILHSADPRGAATSMVGALDRSRAAPQMVTSRIPTITVLRAHFEWLCARRPRVLQAPLRA